MSKLAVIVIGRNEGDRLKTCLKSLSHGEHVTVYVDSNSSDGSLEHALSVGVHGVALDMSRPFTAARARNAGWLQAQQLCADIEWVQFIDGDCELHPQWLATAQHFLASRPGVAVVCGRLRERYPDQSVYNWLCDLEWNTPVGLSKACGGIAMMRASALRSSKGFREDVVAGEEPELCLRLRQDGWEIWRLDAEMALHDAAMTSFRQWWLRAVRSGYAFALGAHLHGAPPERHWVWELRRAIIWGGVLPTGVLASVLLLSPAFALMLLVYPAQCLRLALRSQLPIGQALTDAGFKVMSRIAEFQGSLRFLKDRWKGRAPQLIEYK